MIEQWDVIRDFWDDLDRWYDKHGLNVPHGAPARSGISVFVDSSDTVCCDFNPRDESWAYGEGKSAAEAIYMAISRGYAGMNRFDRNVTLRVSEESQKAQACASKEYADWLERKWNDS